MNRNRVGSLLLAAIFLAGPFVVIFPPLLFPFTLHRWVQTLAAVVVLMALPAALLFPLLYSRSAWWRTHLGTAVMMLEIGVGWVVLTAALRVLREWPHLSRVYRGDPVSVDLTRLAGYGWVMVAVNYMLVALLVVSRRGEDLHSDDAQVRHDHDVQHPPGGEG